MQLEVISGKKKDLAFTAQHLESSDVEAFP